MKYPNYSDDDPVEHAIRVNEVIEMVMRAFQPGMVWNGFEWVWPKKKGKKK